MVTAIVNGRELVETEGVWRFRDTNGVADRLTLNRMGLDNMIDSLECMRKNFYNDQKNARRISLAITNLEQTRHWLGDIDQFEEVEFVSFNDIAFDPKTFENSPELSCERANELLWFSWEVKAGQFVPEAKNKKIYVRKSAYDGVIVDKKDIFDGAVTADQVHSEKK